MNPLKYENLADNTHDNVQNEVNNLNEFWQQEMIHLEKLAKNTENSSHLDIINLIIITKRCRNNPDAQNWLRECGSLIAITKTLFCHLDENQIDLKTECILLALLGSFKKPWNYTNQTYVGFLVIPPIINYFNGILELGKIPNDVTLWKFLKFLLENNEQNRKLFMKNDGLFVTFEMIRTSLLKDICNINILANNMEIILNLKMEKDLAQRIVDLKFDLDFAIKLLRIQHKKLTRSTLQLLNVLTLSETFNSKFGMSSPKIDAIISRRKFHKREIRQKGKKLQEQLLREIRSSSVRKPLTAKFLAVKVLSFIFGDRDVDYVEAIDQAHKDSGRYFLTN